MRARARVEFEYRDAKTAKLVARLLEIDNRLAPAKLKVKSISRRKSVITTVEHERLGTFAATLEDLLFCEKLISELVEGTRVQKKSGKEPAY